MAFDDVWLNTDGIFANEGCSGGPTFPRHTECHSADGSEQRNGPDRHAIRRFSLNTGTINDALRVDLFDFYEARRGMVDSFKFTDPFDYESTNEPIVSGQLVKRYTVGAVSYDRPITKPKSGTISFTGGGTLDYTTGIISGGSGGTWSGQFGHEARFATDQYTEANFFTDWHEVGVEIIETVDADYPALAASAIASTITYSLSLALEVGRRREQQWSTHIHQGGGYSEHRTTNYAARKSGYAANVLLSSKANLEILVSLFLVCRGTRTAFQYETLDVRFDRNELIIKQVGTDAYESSIGLVEVD